MFKPTISYPLAQNGTQTYPYGALGAQQPGNSPGVSFNAVQNIDAKWGLFLRANGESGTAIPIETSVAWGWDSQQPIPAQ